MSRAVIVLSISCLLLSLVGCGRKSGATTTPFPGSTAQPVLPAAGQTVFAVQMRPQAKVQPGFQDKAVAAVSALPRLSDAPAVRSASFNLLDLQQPGANFEQGMGHNRVAPVTTSAQFTPDWTDGDSNPEGLAYCTYLFQLGDYAESGKPQTVGLDWDGAQPPQNFGNLWVGLANWDAQQWDWYAGPEDGVLTLDSLAPYTSSTGQATVMVLLAGAEPATLDILRVGDFELRGTGALDELPGGDVPPLAGEGSLPPSVDLSSACAPINDQGTAASSTAYAAGDGAYNYELAQIYGAYGWDLTQAFNRISPRYLYVESGKLQGFSCPNQGRYSSGAVTYLQDHGVATEQNAPAGLGCDDAWTGEALTDAGLLSVAGFQALPSGTAQSVTSMKVVLAQVRRPLVMRVDLDRGFFDYSPGLVWNYSGPALAGHALTVVGFDDSKQAFKIRNSWSADWGDNGYGWIGYATFASAAANARCWYLWDEYSKPVAQRFCSGFAELEPPVGLTASQGEFDDHIQLNWQASAGATGYYVYRDTQDNLVQTLNSGSTATWDDSGVDDFLAHTYWVRAFSASDESGLSAPALGYKAMPLTLDGLQIDKTTHLNLGTETAAQLSMLTTPEAISYDWTGPGIFTGSGPHVTWHPDSSTPLGRNVLTCVAHSGSFSVEGSVNVYVTDQPILTQLGDQGHFIDFNNKPSVMAPAAPYRSFSYYADGQHAVVFSLWATWCAPARSQMPLINQWASDYAGKLYCVGMNDFNGDTLTSASTYLSTNGYSLYDSYSPWDATVWAAYGDQGFIPLNLLLDQDGNIRRTFVGAMSGSTATAWETTIQQLTGIGP
jgi:thiol-disulfide isomerase/thioredoxin